MIGNESTLLVRKRRSAFPGILAGIHTVADAVAWVPDNIERMLHSRAIVPWKCHVCGTSFAKTSGGICADCRRPTCLACFPLGEKLGKPEAKRCRVCLPESRGASEGKTS